jgi:PAS domain S-box-containing protein
VNDTVRWMQWVNRAIYDSQGKLVEFQSVGRDIDDRKRAEDALQQSQERFQEIACTIDQVFFMRSATTGEFLYISPAYEQIWGRSCESLYQNPQAWIEAIYPDDRPLVLQSVAHQFAGNSVQREYRIVRPDGSVRWVFAQVSLVQNDAGEPLRFVGIAVDITDRKLAEERLRQSEEKLNIIVTATSDGILVLDRRGVVQFANPSATQLLGENLLDYVWGIPTGEIAEIEFPFPNGVRTLEMRNAATTWMGKVAYIVAIRDISDRKQAELELQQAKDAAESANRAKSIFLANMSHELRTPLNVILGFAQIMQQDASFPPNHREHLQILHRSGEHLLHLINDILDLSKIEAGRISLQESPFDLWDLLRTLQEMFRQRAIDKDLQFQLDLAPGVPQFVLSDPNKLCQVLINLLSNAIKFTQSGSVTLRVGSAKGERGRGEEGENPIATTAPLHHPTICFTVEDTGVGIAPEELPLIFDAFAQAQAGKASTEGTGLGLAISQRIVRLLGGELTVESTPGQGTSFQFEAPLHSITGTEIPQSSQQGTVVGLAPGQPAYRILVVDDQPNNRKLLIKQLIRIGLDVLDAASGEEAIALWQDWHPQLIWMDIRMPEIDGCEATRRIRQQESHSTTPPPHHPTTKIIALTAQALMEERDRALAAGCDDFVSKPVQESVLFNKMAEHLGLRYVYQDAEGRRQEAAETDQTPRSTCQTAVSIHIMPPDWIEALRQAALNCNEEEVYPLVEQIPPQHTALIATLNRLAGIYQFDHILHLIHAEPPSA